MPDPFHGYGFRTSARLSFGDLSESGERESFPAFLYVYVDDVETTFQRATAAGAVTLEAPLDTPYGDRRAMVRDPFGNVYQIAGRSTTAD
ncbi:VOC family protein [Nocardia aobensis]|uniref:VOC family protein n=1 Tax=Nocardia aobensis TaxID=257277 RepID=A0ABW6P258_9NOCA